MMDVICQSVVASPLLQYKRDMVVDGSYAPAFAVNQIMKDLEFIGEVSRQDHCPIPLVAQVRQQYEAAFVNGCGDLDFFVLAREAARVAGPLNLNIRCTNSTPLALSYETRRHDTNKNGAQIWEARRSQFLARGRTAPR